MNKDYYQADKMVIEVVGNTSDAPYIQKAELNGNPLNDYFIRHSNINNGVVLKLFMGNQPNKNWGLGEVNNTSIVYNIEDFGAIPDNNTNNAEAIQKAIDACSRNGGGIVLVPSGKNFMSGPFELKSNVNLHFEQMQLFVLSLMSQSIPKVHLKKTMVKEVFG